MRWILRRRYLIASVAAIAVGGAIGVLLLTSKEWESTTTVAVEPVQVAGLRSSTAEVPSPAAAIDAEADAAENDPFRSAVLDGFDYPITYRVIGDVEHGTLRFIVRSDSAERAWFAGYSIANGFLAWGRAMEATTAIAHMQGEIAAIERGDPSPDGASVDSLQQEIAVRQGALDQLAGGTGVVTVPPVVPDDPVSPSFLRWMIVALTAGLVAGLALAKLVDRGHRVPTGDGRSNAASSMTGPTRWGRRVLGAVAVALPVAVVASLLTGVGQVWEMRPTTAATDEENYACLGQWVDAIPDGRTLAVQTDVAFFRDQFQEFAFPRLSVADEQHPADVVLRIAPGPGPQECGGYHLEPRP